MRLIYTMLLLENLKKIDNRIIADFYFPGSKYSGSIVFDVQKKDIIEVKCGDCDPKSIYGFRHLINVLKMMVDNNKYPSRFEYYWY